MFWPQKPSPIQLTGGFMTMSGSRRRYVFWVTGLPTGKYDFSATVPKASQPLSE